MGLRWCAKIIAIFGGALPVYVGIEGGVYRLRQELSDCALVLMHCRR